MDCPFPFPQAVDDEPQNIAEALEVCASDCPDAERREALADEARKLSLKVSELPD